MGILFTILMGFLFTITLGILFTIVLGIQFTISTFSVSCRIRTRAHMYFSLGYQGLQMLSGQDIDLQAFITVLLLIFKLLAIC